MDYTFAIMCLIIREVPPPVRHGVDSRSQGHKRRIVRDHAAAGPQRGTSIDVFNILPMPCDDVVSVFPTMHSMHTCTQVLYLCMQAFMNEPSHLYVQCIHVCSV